MALGGSDGLGRGLPGAPAPEISADDVARRRFGTSFRGFDQHEVRAYLGLLAEELRRLNASLDSLQSELSAVRSAPPPAPDRATLMAALGEETARIVATAEEAAADIRAKAEETATRLRADAETDAAKRNELYAQAQKLLVQEAPVAFINSNPGKFLVKPYVKGAEVTPLDYFVGFFNLPNLEVAP